VLSFFREEAQTPARGRRTKPARPADLGDEEALLCAKCRRRITWDAARVEIGGHHQHTRVNPHGHRFTFGCFSRVEGCVLLSAPSNEWSWFPGYLWQIENCEACGRHLGWCFRAADAALPGFHGLILERLVEGARDL